MRERLVSSLASIFQFLLRLYPQHFREEFGAEMTAVFTQSVEDALGEGGGEVVVVGMRELHDMPQALASVYWYDWTRKWKTGVRALRKTTSTADLPPPPPDGRDSWRRAGLETSFFLMVGLLLIGITYLPLQGVEAGWQRDLASLGRIITPLTLPLFLVGLARGLPRWAYPFGGLLLSYQTLRAYQTGTWPFLIGMLLAYGVLAAASLLTDPKPSPLPRTLRRIGQSLALDWTRLSFGVYGAAPLAIIMAFDDGHINDQTPYLALAVLAMVAGALIYCRSGRREAQAGALLGGMSLSIWAAWLDKVALASAFGLPAPGRDEMAWMLALWVSWAALILVPTLLESAGRLVIKRSF